MNPPFEQELLFSIVIENLKILQRKYHPIKQPKLYNQVSYTLDQAHEAHRLFKLSTSEISDTAVDFRGRIVELVDNKRRASGERE